MKLRMGFVSNSSSTSFTITNKTMELKTLVDFVQENPHLVERFNEEYGYEYTQDAMVANAIARNEEFEPGSKEAVFGDEDGDVLGNVFDYILRDGGESKSFRWRFREYYR